MLVKINKNGILSKTQHSTVTHVLKLVDEMYKYETDLASIVESTERTWFRQQTDRRTDGVKPVHPPPSTSLAKGKIDILKHCQHQQ